MVEVVAYCVAACAGAVIGAGQARSFWAFARWTRTVLLNAAVVACAVAPHLVVDRAPWASLLFLVCSPAAWVGTSSYIVRDYPYFEGVGPVRRAMLCLGNPRALRARASNP